MFIPNGIREISIDFSTDLEMKHEIYVINKETNKGKPKA